jgi:DNA helicase-2/ATP-dependent DNA helicase PcrA
VLQILAGVGPTLARRAFDHLAASGLPARALRANQNPAEPAPFQDAQESSRGPTIFGSSRSESAFLSFEAPPAVRRDLSSLADLFVSLRASPWSGQMALVRAWYEPYLHRNYDDAAARACDLAELERLGADAPTRERFLSDLILDPPQASGDFARPPHLDEDFLILSTIHSAKGQEWRVVYVLHATDGCIPSDMACDTPEQIEEERRLLYVAMTRAKERLHLVHPLRFFVRQQPRYGDKHVLAPRTRFIPDTLLSLFACETHERRGPGTFDAEPGSANAPKIDVAARLRGMWGP